MYSIETLQFEQLLEILVRYCKTDPGAQFLAETEPFSDRISLEQSLSAVSEGLTLREDDEAWYFSEVSEPDELIATLRIENTSLGPMRLLELKKLASQALNAKVVISRNKESAPTLFLIVESLPTQLKEFVSEVESKVTPSGELDDTASPKLRSLRREINSMRGRITKSLEAIMRKNSTAIQDDIVTVRNDRFVIPVKSDHTGKVKGVAHGTSSSGATVFIEPLQSIDANNELRKLISKEEAEIARIIRELTNLARTHLDGILRAKEVVEELDVVNAKLAFSKAFNCVIPKINNDNSLSLKNARHPLLEESLKQEGAEVVPSSFSLTKNESVMVISGANAGGKTVVLKTAGLISLMAISGLPVPAESAEVPFYASVVADIGDHQSLAANLSTFSSHMSNIASMIESLHQPALVLLDEAGTGTDPDEGSALGVAIVDHFRKQGAQVIASTHYKGLKAYAANDESVINASVEFDEKTLRPTYRLIQGLAGASSGLEIARRFGIKTEIVDEAFEHLEEDSKRTASYLKQLQEETRKATELRRALEEEREATSERYSKLDVEFHKKERKRREEFQTELRGALTDFDKKSKELLRKIEDNKRKKVAKKKAEELRAELKRDFELQESRPKPKAKPKAPEIRVIDKPIEKGARVRLKSFGTTGRVEKIEGDKAHVMVGSVRMTQKLSNLERISGPEKNSRSEKHKKQSGQRLDDRSDSKSSSHELNLIGKTTMEAEDEVDRFLDDCYSSRIMRARIIHGHGTGALRRAVQTQLKGHIHVESFMAAEQSEGGNGATIVHLKE